MSSIVQTLSDRIKSSLWCFKQQVWIRLYIKYLIKDTANTWSIERNLKLESNFSQYLSGNGGVVSNDSTFCSTYLLFAGCICSWYFSDSQAARQYFTITEIKKTNFWGRVRHLSVNSTLFAIQIRKQLRNSALPLLFNDFALKSNPRLLRNQLPVSRFEWLEPFNYRSSVTNLIPFQTFRNCSVSIAHWEMDYETVHIIHATFLSLALISAMWCIRRESTGQK